MAACSFLNKEFTCKAKDLKSVSEIALNSQCLEMHQVFISYFYEHSVEIEGKLHAVLFRAGHHINQTVPFFWSDHSSVYLCYLHFNQPSGPNLKSEAVCFSIFKNTYQHVCTRYQMGQVFFQDTATSWRQ